MKMRPNTEGIKNIRGDWIFMWSTKHNGRQYIWSRRASTLKTLPVFDAKLLVILCLDSPSLISSHGIDFCVPHIPTSYVYSASTITASSLVLFLYCHLLPSHLRPLIFPALFCVLPLFCPLFRLTVAVLQCNVFLCLMIPRSYWPLVLSSTLSIPWTSSP